MSELRVLLHSSNDNKVVIIESLCPGHVNSPSSLDSRNCISPGCVCHLARSFPSVFSKMFYCSIADGAVHIVTWYTPRSLCHVSDSSSLRTMLNDVHLT
jgi:hypothetical protein